MCATRRNRVANRRNCCLNRRFLCIKKLVMKKISEPSPNFVYSICIYTKEGEFIPLQNIY